MPEGTPGRDGRGWRDAAFESMERATAFPMLVLSLAVIPLIVVPATIDLDNGPRRALLGLDWSIWALFAAEFGIKTYLAPRRLTYIRSHWFDLVIVAVPFLRPLRVARTLRILRTGSVAAKALAQLRALLAMHGLQYALLSAVVLIFGAAGLVLLVERDAGGAITDYGTAIWWAFSTVTTVGYGDAYPVTPEGRGIAIVLMLIGITLFGLVTANLAAWFIEADQRSGASLDDVLRELEILREQLSEIEKKLG